MKKLLIVCDQFAPQFAPRMGNLVKYLKPLGWKVFVVCGKNNSSRADMDAFVKYPDLLHVVDQKPHHRWNLLHLLNLILPYDYLRNEFKIKKIALEIAKQYKPDLVLVSRSFGLFPTAAGLVVAKKMNIPCVVDIRDVYAQGPLLPIWKLPLRKKIDRLIYNISITERVLHFRCWKKATMLTTVSPWNQRYLQQYNKNVSCIYNGFDPELFNPKDPIQVNVFKIVYTGTFGDRNLRDYSLLFDAMKRLKDEKIITPDVFKVEFYSGSIYDVEVNEWIKRLELEDFILFKDFVPTTSLLEIFRKASILLLLANKPGKYGPWGIMTTKVYEYFAVNRPILLVRSDEDCLATAITEANAGCSGRTVDETYSFLLDKFMEWKRTGVTLGTTNINKIQKYSRAKQAEEFSSLFETLMLK